MKGSIFIAFRIHSISQHAFWMISTCWQAQEQRIRQFGQSWPLPVRLCNNQTSVKRCNKTTCCLLSLFYKYFFELNFAMLFGGDAINAISHDTSWCICLLFSCGLHLTDSYIVNTLRLIEVALELLKAFELNLLRSDILPLRTLYTLRSFILQKTSESPSCNMTGVNCCWSFLAEVNFPNPPPKDKKYNIKQISESK